MSAQEAAAALAEAKATEDCHARFSWPLFSYGQCGGWQGKARFSRPDSLNSVPRIPMMEEENLALKVLTVFCIYTLLTIYKIKCNLFLKTKGIRKSLGLCGTQGPGFCPQSHIHKRMTYISIWGIILICSDYRDKIH